MRYVDEISTILNELALTPESISTVMLDRVFDSFKVTIICSHDKLTGHQRRTIKRKCGPLKSSDFVPGLLKGDHHDPAPFDSVRVTIDGAYKCETKEVEKEPSVHDLEEAERIENMDEHQLAQLALRRARELRTPRKSTTTICTPKPGAEDLDDG